MNSNTQLKSAEEWKKEPAFQRQHVDIADIKEIQLNAYKAGMTEAAEIALNINDRHEWPVSRAILSARDKKETL